MTPKKLSNHIVAITLWEPWASLVMLGRKKWETRSWRTDYRGPLLICAAKAGLSPKELLEILYEPAMQEALAPLKGEMIENASQNVTPNHLNFGKALCLVDLVDCKPTGKIEIGVIEEEGAYGDFRLNRFGWKLDNLRLIKPVPVRGRQGFFHVPLNIIQLR